MKSQGAFRQDTSNSRRPLVDHLGTRLLAAALCLGVVAVHVIDQEGLPGTKDPGYVQALYYALEAGALLTAGTMLMRAFPLRWLLALSVAAAPIIGYILSRGPGLPGYSDDVGNWGEPLGLISLAVEAGLLVTSLIAMGATRRRTVVLREPADA